MPKLSELDNTSYFYGELVKYYDHEVDKSKFPSLESFLNFNKKLPGPIFKDEYNGHRITEFVGLRPKMYCLIDEKHVVHNTAKGVPRNVVIDGKRMSVKNIELYKRVLEAEKKGDAVMEGSFKRINNQGFIISTKEQTKTLMTCTDNKRWILDDNVHTHTGIRTLSIVEYAVKTVVSLRIIVSEWDSDGSDGWVPILVRLIIRTCGW